MTKSTLFVLLLTGWYAGIVAQEARPVTFYGHIKSDRDSVKLIVWFGNDPTVGPGSDDVMRIQAPVNPDGTFSFTTPPVSRFARMELFEMFTGNYFGHFNECFVAPGDSIHIAVDMKDKEAPRYSNVVFSGKGGARLECLALLKTDPFKLGWQELDKARDLQRVIKVYDSMLNSKLAILESYKSRLSANEYDLITIDIIGELKLHALWNICDYNPGGVHNPKRSADTLAERKKLFDQLMGHFQDASFKSKFVVSSLHYRRYLDNKAKAEQVFVNKGEGVTISQLFKRLNTGYSGELRDKLIGRLFLNVSENYMYFGGIDPDEYLECLKIANAVIQSEEIKDKINQKMLNSSKGAAAFNFTLPLDSSQTQKVSLADFKGKVVLLDLWSYQCTGCIVFANTFHKKIYPAFQNNPDFAVVSIMLDAYYGKEKYLYRLRNGGGVAYTFPEYVNLYGGKGIVSARELEKYHTIFSRPTIMLIDKQGKIYSSTLPAIYGDSRNKEVVANQQKLINLIQKALSEPAAKKPVL